MWNFLRWVLESMTAKIDAKLDKILDHQHQCLLKQEETRSILMAVKQTVEQHAAAVNAFSDQIAASIEGVRQDIADLKAELVDASTPAEVDAILAPALAKLGAQADALKALDEENVPAIPDVPPDVPPPDEPL